ncbi:hypothetical protein Tco_1376610 [Tanacetum coccineum]
MICHLERRSQWSIQFSYIWLNRSVEDVSLTWDTSLEVFNNEFNRTSGIDDDLYTYEIEVANIPCDSNMDDDSKEQMSHEADDNTGYDPSDVAFTEWLGSKFFNYKTMDHYTMKALWIYWIRGDDEIELTDEKSFDDEDEVAETYLQRTLRDLRPMKITRMIRSMNGTKMYHGLMRNHRPKLEYGLNQHLLNIVVSPSIIKQDVLNGQPVVGERMVIVMEEIFSVLTLLETRSITKTLNDDDESCYKRRRQWNVYTNYDDAYETNHDVAEREELCEIHELAVCDIRRFEMIKYLFGQNEEYVDIKENEYDDLTNTCNDAFQAYQEIFRMMDEGWMVTRAE